MIRIRLAVVAAAITLVGCGGGPGAAAAPDSLLSLQTLLAPATNVAPQVSPDGRWISFLRPVEGAMNLFVAPVDSIEAARPVTRRTGRGLQPFDVSGNVLYRWTKDSRRILFPEDNNGDEKWNLHVVDVTTGAETNLTPLPGVEVSFLGYSDDDPNLAAIAVKERGPFIPDLYRLDLTTGTRTLILRNDAMVAVLSDGHLKPRLGIGFSADGSLDFYRPTPEGGWSLIWDVSPDDVAAISSTAYQRIFSFDGENRRLYLYDTEGRDAAVLAALDPETGRRETIFTDSRGDPAGVLYHPVTRRVQAYATMWTRTTWTVIDSSVQADFDRLAKVADGDLKVLSRSDDLGKWVVQYTLSDAPTAFYLYDRASGRATRLFVGTPQLAGFRFSKLHPFELTSSDSLPLVSYYLLPPWTDPDGDGQPAAPVPAVVLVHGGPGDERAQWAFGPFVHWLANRGYAVLYLNFRGSPGFGKKFLNAANMEWGGKMHTDLLEQVDWAIERKIVAAGKVAIMGGSYGGYATLVGMTMTPDRFACGVDLVGPSNLEKFMPHWNVDRMAVVVGDPRTEEGRRHLRARSPINFAGQTKNPVLIGQGSNDSRVPKYQSDTVVAAMRGAGVPVVYAVYPDEGHGLVRPENSFSFWAIAEQFLARCLGGRAMPLPPSFAGSSIQVEAGADYVPGLAAALAATDSLTRKTP